MTRKQADTFKPGDRVWFISKFGDRVTGIYEKESTIPGVHGEIKGHNVRSDNAFGADTTLKGVLCFVQAGHLHKEG